MTILKADKVPSLEEQAEEMEPLWNLMRMSNGIAMF
jgi:hypothetical protein